MAKKEYIERELIEEFLESSAEGLHGTPMFVELLLQCRDRVKEIPAADVAPVVHARWKDNHCTACGMMPMGEELWDSCEFAPPKFEFFMDYCPSYGARMDGGKHG